MDSIKSLTIAELTKALCKAQGQLENAEKDAQNPHFRSSYATLASVINAVKKPLSENGLAYAQTMESSDTNIYLVTTLFHISGEWITSRLRLFLSKSDMQGLGSSISYARRYALSSIIGISQADDDGNSSVGHKPFPSRPMPSKETFKEQSHPHPQPPPPAFPPPEFEEALFPSQTEHMRVEQFDKAPECCGRVMMVSKYDNDTYWCTKCKSKVPFSIVT